MLYPLNALINSQRGNAWSDWTKPFKGDLRFCLYNGETPNDFPAADQAKTLEEVRSRHLLRRDPPPVLVTNITMLEYMLVRKEDQAYPAALAGTVALYHPRRGAFLRRIAGRRTVAAPASRNPGLRCRAGAGSLRGHVCPRSGMRMILAHTRPSPLSLRTLLGVSRDAVSVIEGHRQPPDLTPRSGWPRLAHAWRN